MDDLIAFLRERIDEDERTARRGEQWLDESPPDLTDFDRAAQKKRIFDVLGVGGILPDRVLREVEAKRRILDELEGFVAGSEYLPNDERNADKATAFGIARLLALPYADHESYRDEWRP